MVEEGDLDDKLEDKATNEVVDDVKKVAMEGVDKERKQVAMKVANTNCLDDLIDNALLLLFNTSMKVTDFLNLSIFSNFSF